MSDFDDQLRAALDRSLAPTGDLLAAVQRGARRARTRRRGVLITASAAVLALGVGVAVATLGQGTPDRLGLVSPTDSPSPAVGTISPCTPKDLGFALTWKAGENGSIDGALTATKITAGSCDFNLKPQFVPRGADGNLLDTQYSASMEGRGGPPGAFDLHHGESVQARLLWVTWCGLPGSSSVLIGTSREEGRFVEADGPIQPTCDPSYNGNQTSSDWYHRIELTATDSPAVACAQRFPDVRVADRNTALGAHSGGPVSTGAPSPATFFGFAADTQVDECLVPVVGGEYEHEVLYPDGQVEHGLLQNVSDVFLRPV